MGGPLMETAVLSEITKALTHRGVDPRLYYWRTSAGSEVDILMETGEKLVPIDVKLSATPRPSMAASIKIFRKDFKNRVLPGYLIHPGDVRLPLGEQVTALPFYAL